MTARQMRLGLSIRGHGYHPAAWRHPDVPADGTLHVEHYVRSTQIAERGKLDMIFFADGAGIRQGDHPRGALSRTGRDMLELEPMTLLPALAMVSNHVGLVTTASTTYNEPYNLARKFATLDLISNGRAGWNVVASWSELEAQNFGLETTLDYDTRYARSAEFVDVVKGLWDGWEGGALLFDKTGGRYFDDAKMHVLNHRGRFFKVRGPLNVAGMPQGHPIIVQAGASDQGRELGAATADVIYAIHNTVERARNYYDDVKGRMAKYGRDPDDLKIMPAFCPVVGRTRAEAQAKYDALQALIEPLAGLGSLYSSFGDLSDYPLDGPVPDNALGHQEHRSVSAQLVEWVKREKPTIRELYSRSGITGSARIGTPADIADTMQEWFEASACDGFNITPATLPGGGEDFVTMVVPELQRRGLFRTEYEGRTLRDNLGLRPVRNRYSARRQE
jgi:FMN-dependent oxidoreductase (nitrilotriacetate monooxygenase family)